MRGAFEFGGKRLRISAVQNAAIGVDDGGEIVLALHSALDLERDDARRRKLLQVRAHVQILAVHHIRAAPVPFEVAPAALPLALNAVCAAARLHARAAVGGAAVEIVGEITPAAVRNAHCAVYERFKFHRGHLGVDFGDLRKREFARKHDAARAQLGIRGGGAGVRDVRLRGDMHRERGRGLAAERERAEVGDEHRVRPQPFQRAEMFRHGGKIGVARKDIGGGIHLFAAFVRVCDPLGEFFVRKIIGKSAERKVLSAHVHRVRAETERAFEFCKISRRRKKFRFRHLQLLRRRFPRPCPRSRAQVRSPFCRPWVP